MNDLVFNVEEYENRHDLLRTGLEKLELEHAMIFNRADLFYYSNTGLDGLIHVSNEMTRYVRRNKDLGVRESVIPVKLMKSFRLFKEIGKGGEFERLGLELDILPYKTVEYIRKSLGGPDVVDISDLLRKIRSVKSPAEQDLMRLAMKQTDDSFEYIEDKIKPGMSELEISAEIEYFLRREGHPGFVNVRMFHHNLTTLSYVMTGGSTATLNSQFGPVSGQGLCKLHKNGPSRRKISNNSAVLIDTTGVVEGYTGDETRTFFFGNPDHRLLDAYEAAKQIQERAGTIMKEGAMPADIYSELNQLATELDIMDEFMGHNDDKVPFIGHGVGLELDEYPIITDKFDYPLKSGNIIALEPKMIYSNIPSGVGIEDCWIVGENGSERITNYPW